MLQERIFDCRSRLELLDSKIKLQNKCTYDVWRKKFDDLSVKLKITEQKREEVSLINIKTVSKIKIFFFKAISEVKSLQKELYLLQGASYIHGLRSVLEIKNVSLSVLKSLQNQLCDDLEKIEKVLVLIYLCILYSCDG